MTSNPCGHYKSVLRNIYRTLLNYGIAAVSSSQAAVDEHVAQALLSSMTQRSSLICVDLMEKLTTINLILSGMSFRHAWMENYMEMCSICGI